MSNINKTIRNPFIYSGEGVKTSFRIPFEISEGDKCTQRNAITTPYQTFSPYLSNVDKLSELVNISELGCDEIIKQQAKEIYSYSEDIHGNKYLLFKDQTNLTIDDKKKSAGILNVLDIDGNKYEDLFGNFTLSDGLTTNQVQVFYDKILIVDNNKIWLANSLDRNFVALDYISHYEVFLYDGDIYILFDDVLSEFNIFKYDGHDVTKITTESLNDNITSASFKLKDNRAEIVYTDSVTNQKLTFAEYDFNDNSWSGFTAIDFSYELLGVHDGDGSWYVYYEGLTYPNHVGGLCIKFSNPTTPIVENVCETKGDLSFTTPDFPQPPVDPLLCDPDVLTFYVKLNSIITGGDEEIVTVTGSLNVPLGTFTTIGGYPIYFTGISAGFAGVTTLSWDSGLEQWFMETFDGSYDSGCSLVRCDPSCDNGDYQIQDSLPFLACDPDVISYTVTLPAALPQYAGGNVVVNGSLNTQVNPPLYFEGSYVYDSLPATLGLEWDEFSQIWGVNDEGFVHAQTGAQDRCNPVGTYENGISVAL